MPKSAAHVSCGHHLCCRSPDGAEARRRRGLTPTRGETTGWGMAAQSSPAVFRGALAPMLDGDTYLGGGKVRVEAFG